MSEQFDEQIKTVGKPEGAEAMLNRIREVVAASPKAIEDDLARDAGAKGRLPNSWLDC